MKWNELISEKCPVARAVAAIGDRWTIMILRDCFGGATRFDQLHKSLGITRHVLADRLSKLEQIGILKREPYQTNPPRFDYLLTDKGKELHPVLLMLTDWGNKHMPLDPPIDYNVIDKTTGTPIEPRVIDINSGRVIEKRSAWKIVKT